MHKFLTSIFLSLALLTPAFADTTPTTPETTIECKKVGPYVDYLLKGVPGAGIKSFKDTPPYEIVLTSDQMPTDYKITFDENGCVLSEQEISKVQASN